MLYDNYSPVGGTGIAFYCIEDSEQSDEIWTKGRTNPSGSMTKAVKALGLYGIEHKIIFNGKGPGSTHTGAFSFGE